MNWFAKYKLESAATHRSMARMYFGMSRASELGSFARFYVGEARKQLRYAIGDIQSAKRIIGARNERAA